MRFFVIIFSFFFTTHALGEFSVLVAPPSLTFRGRSELDSGHVGEVLAACMGLPVYRDTNWDGLYVNDPFNIPQYAIVLVVDGVDSLPLSEKLQLYPVTGNSLQTSLNSLTSNLEERSILAVDVDLNQGRESLLTYSDVLGDIEVPTNFKPYNALKPSLHSEDKLFLQQISIIKALVEKFDQYEKRPNLLTIRLSLAPITTAHGEKSQAMTDALKLLSETARNIITESKKIYKGKILFVAVTNKVDSVRTKRDTKEAEKDPNPLNLAVYYSEDYPVIFNIILWFGVVIAFALLAISYTIATMDPGRDSIIYRMTSTRMKKDN